MSGGNKLLQYDISGSNIYIYPEKATVEEVRKNSVKKIKICFWIVLTVFHQLHTCVFFGHKFFK